MARLPSVRPVEVEPVVPAYAEEWFDAHDVRDAIAAGHDGEALLDHLATLAGERYATADVARIQDGPGPLMLSARDGVVAIRPEVSTGHPEIVAHRHWLLSRRCHFRDSAAFLAAVRG